MQTATTNEFNQANLPNPMLEGKLFNILKKKLHTQSLQVIKYELEYLQNNVNAKVCVDLPRERAIEIYNTFISDAKSAIYRKTKKKKGV